nr:substrate-binding domain-containing protein [Clostridia bacterium]
YNTHIGSLPSVMPDNEDGAALSAQHLLSMGHARIGFINVPGYINSEKRLSRFQSEIRKFGLDDSALTIAEGDWTEDSGYRAARELLSREPDITAIFGGNDSMAIGAMRAAKELGLSVPEHLSVIGFDGIAQSALTHPPLTTLQVDVKVMAEAACMLLTHMMAEGISRGIHAVVATDLIIRGSTAAPRNREKSE